MISMLWTAEHRNNCKLLVSFHKFITSDSNRTIKYSMLVFSLWKAWLSIKIYILCDVTNIFIEACKILCISNYFLLLIYLSVNIFYTGRQCKLLSNKESLVISHWIQKTILWSSDMAGLHYKRIQYAEDERQERSMIMNGNVGTCHVYSKNCKRGYSHVNFPHSSVD